MINVADLITDFGIDPKLVSSTNGGEFASPCPECGGRDRFRVWPEQSPEGGGRYWCRQCEKKGDAIQFLRDFKNMTFPAAKEYLGVDSSLDRRPQKKVVPPVKKTSTLTDGGKWSAKAAGLVEFAHEKLLNDPDQLEWLRTERGLTAETVKLFKLGWLNKNYFRSREAWGLPFQQNDKGKAKKLFIPAGLIIPKLTGNGQTTRVRVRKRKEDDYGKYYVLPGSDACQLEIGLEIAGKPVIVVESELDGLLLAQGVWEAAVIALGSVTTRPGDDLRKKLAAAPAILLALDSDEAGGKQSFGWWPKNFNNTMRTPVPKKYGKDHTEAFLNGLDLVMWFRAACIMAGVPLTVQKTDFKRVSESCHRSTPESPKTPEEHTATVQETQINESPATKVKTDTENFNELVNFFDKKTLSDTKHAPGHEWVTDHLAELQAAGFTDNDLFRENLPRGIFHMRIFEKSDLNIKIKPGLLTFIWKNIHGEMIKQTCRPEKFKQKNEVV